MTGLLTLTLTLTLTCLAARAAHASSINPDDYSSACDTTLNEISIASLAYGIFLVVATPLSYIPGIWRIVQKRSSYGVSFATQFCCCLKSATAVANVIILKWIQFELCVDLPWHCQQSLLSFYSIACVAISGIILYFVAVVFHKPVDADGERSKNSHLLPGLAFSFCVLIFTTFVTVACVWSWFNPCTESLVGIAHALGVAGTIIVAVEYVPQLWLTIRARTGGSLSPLMYVIQGIGSYMFFSYQAFFAGEKWSTWVPFLVTGILQTVEVSLIFYFDGFSGLLFNYQVSKGTKGDSDNDQDLHWTVEEPATHDPLTSNPHATLLASPTKHT